LQGPASRVGRSQRPSVAMASSSGRRSQSPLSAHAVAESSTSSRAASVSPLSVVASVDEVVCPVEERGLKCSVARSEDFASLNGSAKATNDRKPLAQLDQAALDEAYERCGLVTEYYAKTFFLGTQLMTPEKARAIWAIYVWCRRTDELVDGPHASKVTPKALARWEERLEAVFDGEPYDMLDAALADTVRNFPVDIQAFRDMVDGMRMDLVKARYQTFEELYEYCYRVAGTVGLMTTPVMGIAPKFSGEIEETYGAALALGIANQLTNILRDVGEDVASRDRIYVPLDELERFGIAEEEVLNGSLVTEEGGTDERWRKFMKFQIERARYYFKLAEDGVMKLEENARWPVLSALVLYQQILDSIEANDYDNFNQRAYVGKLKKLASLPKSYWMVIENNLRNGA